MPQDQNSCKAQQTYPHSQEKTGNHDDLEAGPKVVWFGWLRKR